MNKKAMTLDSKMSLFYQNKAAIPAVYVIHLFELDRVKERTERNIGSVETHCSSFL